VNKYDYSYEIITHSMGKKLDAKIYMFNGKRLPRLHLNNKTEFVNDVNKALHELNLPKIIYPVVDLESLTGFRTDRGFYEWPNYPLGKLQVERHTFNGYDCIWKIYIYNK
jgi:hypothetical protein